MKHDCGKKGENMDVLNRRRTHPHRTRPHPQPTILLHTPNPPLNLRPLLPLARIYKHHHLLQEQISLVYRADVPQCRPNRFEARDVGMQVLGLQAMVLDPERLLDPGDGV